MLPLSFRRLRTNLSTPACCWLLGALLIGGLADTAYAQTATVTFRPGPGLNDGSDEGGATSGMDTTLISGNFNSFGANSVLRHFNSPCNGIFAHSYYQFDVSSLPSADLVTNVDLVLFQRIGASNGSYPTTGTTMQVRAVTEPWNEMTLVPGNVPDEAGDVDASVAIANNGGAGATPPC